MTRSFPVRTKPPRYMPTASLSRKPLPVTIGERFMARLDFSMTHTRSI